MTAASFKGWVRLPGQPWQSVVTASAEEAAWQLLRVHVERLGARLIDLCVLQAGDDPNQRRRRRGRDSSQQEIFE